MNSIEVVRRGGDETVGYACAKCGEVYKFGHKWLADRCCDPRCEDCGEPCHGCYVVCDAHRKERAAKNEAELFAKAAKLTRAEWNGPVFDPSEATGDDGYGRDFDHLLRHVSEEDWPAYVWACDATKPSLSIGSVLDLVCEEHHENVRDQLKNVAELEAAIDEFNAKQTTETWSPDYSRAIVLRGEANG